MDLSGYSNDELADASLDWIAEVESRIEGLDAGPMKEKAQEHAARIHARLNKLNALFTDAGVIQPFSGGEPKP